MSDEWKWVEGRTVVSNAWLTVECNTYDVSPQQRIADYYVVRRRPFALVVAECDGLLVLVRQYRPATELWYESVPGGYIDPLETPESAARRELLEEVGLEARELHALGRLDPLPGYIESAAHIFFARCSGTPCCHDQEEGIAGIRLISWADTLAAIVANQLNEMQAVAAILLASAWKQTHSSPSI